MGTVSINLFETGDIITSKPENPGRYKITIPGINLRIEDYKGSTGEILVEVLDGKSIGTLHWVFPEHFVLVKTNVESNKSERSFSVGETITILSKERYKDLFEKEAFHHGGSFLTIAGTKAIVKNYSGSKKFGTYDITVSLFDGRIYTMSENEFEEYYEKKLIKEAVTKIRLSYKSKSGIIKNEIIEAKSLSEAKEKLSDVDEVFYHMNTF